MDSGDSYYKIIEEEDSVLAGIELKKMAARASAPQQGERQLEKIRLPEDPFAEDELAEKRTLAGKAKSGIFTDF